METRKILGEPDRLWSSPYTQQGDCLLKRCGNFGAFEKEYDKIPDNANPIKGNLVLKGDTNSHALYDGKFQLLTFNDVLFIRVDKPCVLDHVKDHNAREHAEHYAQWIPKGEYFFDGILEYDHITEESRQVID